MRIVLTADTHLPAKTRTLPEKLLQACATADTIIHAGDWSEMEVYEILTTYAPVVGVHGNVDGEEKNKPFQKEISTKWENQIGIVHGHEGKKTTEKNAIDAFEDVATDIIIFGHSHIPLMRYAGKKLLINPGSPTYKRKLPFYSFGVLELNNTIKTSVEYF